MVASSTFARAVGMNVLLNVCSSSSLRLLGPSLPLYASESVWTFFIFFFFSSRRRHTRSDRDWSSDVCSSDLQRSTFNHLGRGAQGAGSGGSTNAAWASRLRHSAHVGDLRIAGLRSRQAHVGRDRKSVV